MNIQLKQNVYWTELKYEDWTMHMAATADGLCYVGTANKPYEEMEAWVFKHFRHHALVRNDVHMLPYAEQLMDYMKGSLHEFSIPFDLAGTPFQVSVWDALCKIPYGETCSYSDIANRIGKPSSVRAVGTAIGANPVLISIPCHRVIGKNGALTGYRGGLMMKTRLLKLEKNACEVGHHA